MRYENEKIGKALQFLNGDDFHKRLRTGFKIVTFVFILDEFVHSLPAGQSRKSFFHEICTRQTHILPDAIDRVSAFILFWYNFKVLILSLFIPLYWIQLVFNVTL